VRYRTSVSRDAASQAELARAEQAWHAGDPRTMGLYRRLAISYIEAWDATDRGGQPLPITEQTLAMLPLGALRRLVREATRSRMGGG